MVKETVLSEKERQRLLEFLTTHLAEDHIVKCASDDLSDAERARVTEHLSMCADCRCEVEEARTSFQSFETPHGRASLDRMWASFREAVSGPQAGVLSPAAAVHSSDATTRTTRFAPSPTRFWKWWTEIGSMRYALVGLTAVVFVLANALAFMWGRNSVLERAAPLDASVTDAGIVNTALQRQLAVAGLIQQLSSRDPRERVAALRTGQIMRLPYITDLAERHATVERDRTVREAATAIILESPNATAAIERVSSARTLHAELGTPDIRRMLEDADGYVLGGASNGAPEAVRLYSEILGRLSRKARSGLRAESVEAAKRDAAARRFDEAAIRFRELFADFQVTDEVARTEK